MGIKKTYISEYKELRVTSSNDSAPANRYIITEKPENAVNLAGFGGTESRANSIEVLVHTKSTNPTVTLYGGNKGGPMKRLVTLTCTNGSELTESGGSSWIATMVATNVAHVGINGVDTSSDGDIGAARFDNVGNEFLEAVVTGIDAETTVLMRYI